MEVFTIRNLSFAYPEQEKQAISDLTLSLQPGEFLVLCGPSGCGKSTLLRQLKTVLAPHGRRSGEILFDGRNLDSLDQREQAETIGFVQQSPENQIATDKVWHELAFGLESLGYETRTLFEVLNAVGAYPATGKFAGVNDNPSYVSRTTDYFATSFPNGATAVVKHYRTHPESWPGGFSRNREEDVKALEANPLPCDRMELRGLKVNGHEVTYDRSEEHTSELQSRGHLDGVRYSFSEQPVSRIVFAPSLADEKVTEVLVEGQGRVTLPLAGGKKKPVVKLGKKTIKTEVADGQLVLNVDPSISGRWLTVHR